MPLFPVIPQEESRNSDQFLSLMARDPRRERFVRRTTMVAAATAAYFLFVSDYGSQDGTMDPVKKITESIKLSAKRFIFNSDKEDQLNDEENMEQKNVK